MIHPPHALLWIAGVVWVPGPDPAAVSDAYLQIKSALQLVKLHLRLAHPPKGIISLIKVIAVQHRMLLK